MAWVMAGSGTGRSITHRNLSSNCQHQGFAVNLWKADIQDMRQASPPIAIDVMFNSLQVVEQLLADLQGGGFS